MKTTKFFASAFLGLALLASCSDDDDGSGTQPVEEEEAITRLILTFTNDDETDTVILTWNDANLDEVIDAGEQTVVGEFDADEVYDAEIQLFNMDEDFLAEDILADQAGIDAHFFVYSTDLDFTMVRADDDNLRGDGNRLGVKTVWTAGPNDETGTITIQLFHESPSVSDDGGFGSATGTDTDIDITFNVEID
ncbi:hypothetical protein [Winogradskyella sp.]|uniref:hypothetical protein n=1 Tax=Winogradskyella sp. TaxID=1883156 RepID=UPI0026340CDC|nr:hypothetical protein [Winogradskyella sp.]